MRRLLTTFKLLSLSVLLTLSTGIAYPLVLSHVAEAASAADWQSGNIMDDGTFYNNSDMTADQIQSFLNGKVPVCDTQGTQTSEYGGGTRAQYGIAHGYAPPYVCLKNYYENPTTHANNLSGNPIPSGALSAAQIIKNAADTYGISPRVLITIIQKESVGPLITDTWPFPSQYTNALGYGCPDSAPCDPSYAGFYNQVNNAARQLQNYENHPTNFRYQPNQNNTIQYNPNTGCGSSTVFIKSKATAGLYDYTPYQPNQAALNNMYGSGDSCSSYGNRNFWRIFSDWFGSPYAPAFAWESEGVVIEDENKNSEIPTDNMHSGERLYAQVAAKNVGSVTWTNSGSNPILLATVRPNNSYTPYCDITWVQLCDRPATLSEASVAPGEIGHFNFYMAVPNAIGQYRTFFAPVAEGQSWMSNDAGFNIYVNDNGSYEWQWLYFDAYTDATKTTPVSMDHVTRGQQIYIVLHVRNRSATVWSNSGPNPADLGTSNPQDQMSPLCTNTWISCNRPAVLDQSTLAPGQEGTFSFAIKAPSTLGVYRQYVRPVLEYKGWTRDDSNVIYMNVTQ